MERGQKRKESTRTATTTTTTIPGTCVEPEICRRGLDGTSRRVPTTEYVHPVRTLHPRLTLGTLPLAGATLVAPPPATPSYPPRDSTPKYRGCAAGSLILTWSADARCTLVLVLCVSSSVLLRSDRSSVPVLSPTLVINLMFVIRWKETV